MRAAVRLLVAIAVLALAGCGAVEVAEPRPSLPPLHAKPTALPGASSVSVTTVAVVGDSITDVQSPDFSAGRIDPASWVSRILDDRHVFAGGWAEWGATTQQMRDGVGEFDADVLVVLAGTNDVALGVPFGTSAENLTAIVAKVGAPRVVVSAIPPFDPEPGAREAFNMRLRSFVRGQGWEWVDPMTAIGSGGRYIAGASLDGVHPTAEASRRIGDAIAAALWER